MSINDWMLFLTKRFYSRNRHDFDVLKPFRSIRFFDSLSKNFDLKSRAARVTIKLNIYRKKTPPTVFALRLISLILCWHCNWQPRPGWPTETLAAPEILRTQQKAKDIRCPVPWPRPQQCHGTRDAAGRGGRATVGGCKTRPRTNTPKPCRFRGQWHGFVVHVRDGM